MLMYISPKAQRLEESLIRSAIQVHIDSYGKNINLTSDPHEADFIIFSDKEQCDFNKLRDPVYRGGTEVFFYCIFKRIEDAIDLIIKMNQPVSKHYEWQWKWTEELGYEVTSKGDRRFSPFYQFIDYNGLRISLEDYYHNIIKPQKEAGTYIEGTGHELMKDYLKSHPGLLYELAYIGRHHPFTDMFDKHGGQNKWYAEILNELLI